MIRVAIFLVLLFLAFLAARVVRLLWAAVLSRSRKARTVEGEMVRDPICGVWIDRRLAIVAGAGAGAVQVCSENCRRALEKKAAL